LQIFVEIRKKCGFLFIFMPSNYEFNEPLDVPAYAIGQGIVRQRIAQYFVSFVLHYF